MPIQNTEQVVEAQKGKPRCIIYFNPAQTQVVKELAGKIRAENKIANLVAAALFDESMVESCHAVAIQVDVPKVSLIARCYRKHRPDTEQHFFDSEGNWVDAPEIEEANTYNMPTLGSKDDESVEPAPPSEEEVAQAKEKLKQDMGIDSAANPDVIPETQDEVNERADKDAAESREAIADPVDSVGSEGDGEKITQS